MTDKFKFDPREFLNNLSVASFILSYDRKTRVCRFEYYSNKAKEFLLKIISKKQIEEGFHVQDILSDTNLELPNIDIFNKLLNGKPILIENQEYLMKAKGKKQIIIKANFQACLKSGKIILKGTFEEKAEVVQETIDKLELEKEIKGFRELFQVFNGVIMIVNEEGRFLFVSPNVGDNFLYKPRSEIIGRTFQEIFPPGLTKFFHRLITEVIETKQVKDIEYHLPIQNKVKWYKSTALPIEQSEGELRKVIAIIWEITNLKIKPQE